MARHYRRRTGRRRPFGLAAVAPWWLWLLLVVPAYLLFSHLAAMQLDAPSPGRLPVVDILVKAMSIALQSVIPGSLLLCSIFSAIYRRRDADHSSQPRSDHSRHDSQQTRPQDSPSSAGHPSCPVCDREMVLRSSRGKGASKPFWGCEQYPSCRGTRQV